MSLPSQTAQKTKPVLIAVAIIVTVVFVISQAPDIVRSLSSIGQ